jgi:hypothetical protein
MHFLPLLRRHLVAAACRYALTPGLTIDLLPIVEDGLFGYELLPDRNTHTYVTIGCNAQGKPVLRKTLYDVGATNALQLVAVNGHILSRSERASRYEAQQGFALKGANGEHGELVFQRPDIWMLRWRAPPQAVYESWSVVVPDLDAALDTVHRDLAS